MNTIKKTNVKVAIGDFLTGKQFQNSKVALKEFSKTNPDLKVCDGYFYTLFKTFGTVKLVKEDIINFVQTCTEKRSMNSFRAYQKAMIEKGEKPVSYIYFLSFWKKNKGVERIKFPKAKIESTVNLTGKTAKEIKKVVSEKTGQDITVADKNKKGVVAKAKNILTSCGYIITE